MALVVLLAGCSGLGPADPPGSAGPDGWRRVGFPGTVRALDRKVAVGDRDGKPAVGALENGVAWPVTMTGGPGTGLRAVSNNGTYVAVAERTYPAAGKPAALWTGLILSATEDIAPDWSRETVSDRAGRPAAWLDPLLDGEENFRVVGAVRTGDTWTLHGWQQLDEWLALDTGDQLRTRADPARLRTATTETTVVVAGEVSESAGSGAGPQVWWLYDGLAAGDPDASGRWTHAPTATRPDGITDVASWDLGWWVAGHRGLRPVVYDFDDAEGAELPVPAADLDPERPTVLVADVPVDAPLVLAVQARTGVEVWTDAGGGRWTRVPGPRGILQDAMVLPEDGLYLVVDGVLWHRPLDARPPTPEVPTPSG